MNSDPRQHPTVSLRDREHPNCVVCSPTNGAGLGLDFRLVDGRVAEAVFDCGTVFQGYPDMLHGGILCALVDGAMVNCMFAHGRAVATVDMEVRFRRPVATGTPVVVRGWIERNSPPLFYLAAEVLQNDRLVASAKGTFVDKAALVP